MIKENSSYLYFVNNYLKNRSDQRVEPGVDGVGPKGPWPPLLTASSCKFSLFGGYISHSAPSYYQFRHMAPNILEILDLIPQWFFFWGGGKYFLCIKF